MYVTYNNLFKLLIDCRQLDCSLGDVVQLAPPEPPIKSGLERMKKRRPTLEKGGNAYRHE